ncbi:hypothetical protein BT69DRAFT_1291145 [Atractiella rhizophila]|nr:hypothetical protein BT69DRAFT_1291145 [Atractiella rhizophila]
MWAVRFLPHPLPSILSAAKEKLMGRDQNMFRKMVPFVDTATWNSTIPEWGRVNM